MTSFIEKQQIIAGGKSATFTWEPMSDEALNELVVEIITNTVEEVRKRLEDLPGTTLPDSYSESPEVVSKVQVRELLSEILHDSK